MVKRVFFIIFILMLNSASVFSNDIQEKEPTYRAFVIGDEKGRIFSSENEREKYPLASVTKVMTLLLTYDAIERGEINLQDKVTVDEEMATMGGSKIWMKKGSQITVEDLIKATAVHSANNAAYGLAKLVGGSIDNFVRMMNQKARELGFGDEITYNTPSGLPPDMTGRKMDMGSALGVYKLSLASLKYEDYLNVASKKSVALSYLGKRRIYNRNKLLGKEGIYGIKTGHLDNWYNIAVASKKGVDSISVVIGSPTEKNRDDKILEEISNLNKEYNKIDFLNDRKPVGVIPVENSSIKEVEFYVENSFEYAVKNEDEVKFLIYRNSKLQAPVKSGQSIGSYELRVNTKVVASGNIIIKDEVELY